MKCAISVAIAALTWMLAAPAWAAVCVEVDKERDNLQPAEQATVRIIVEDMLKAHSFEVSRADCDAVYTIYNLKLGAAVTATISGPEGSKSQKANGIEELPEVYDQLVGALADLKKEDDAKEPQKQEESAEKADDLDEPGEEESASERTDAEQAESATRPKIRRKPRPANRPPGDAPGDAATDPPAHHEPQPVGVDRPGAQTHAERPGAARSEPTYAEHNSHHDDYASEEQDQQSASSASQWFLNLGLGFILAPDDAVIEDFAIGWGFGAGYRYLGDIFGLELSSNMIFPFTGDDALNSAYMGSWFRVGSVFQITPGDVENQILHITPALSWGSISWVSGPDGSYGSYFGSGLQAEFGMTAEYMRDRPIGFAYGWNVVLPLYTVDSLDNYWDETSSDYILSMMMTLGLTYNPSPAYNMEDL